jgi:phosphoglycolate phosphatase-like HAD superfamily hydrolase
MADEHIFSHVFHNQNCFMTHPAGPVPLEIVNRDHLCGPFRCAVFDFDGTLSLLRGNWQGLMVPMMVEALAATGSGESPEQLTAIVEEFVTRLTGQPTMQQMQALCDEVQKRGRPRPDPEAFLTRYLEMLIARTQTRIDDVDAGRVMPDDLLVPGSRPLVERLLAAGWLLAIASGTELSDVCRESGVLKIDRYFGPQIFGPVNNDASFSKERALRQLMAEHSIFGNEIVAIGDGPAEMLAIKAVGGLAIGVASDEVHRDGRINRLKREHLLRAGADVIISDYRDLTSVIRLLTSDI